jgi:hypothetical protein
VSPDPLETERTRDTQRPREHPTALRETEACQIGMQMRSPAGHPTVSIRKELTVHHDDTQQV